MEKPDRTFETKTLELLHSEARDALVRQLERYYSLEVKIGRHFAVLVVLAGTFTIGVPTVLEAWHDAQGLTPSLFGVSYPALLVVTFLGLFSVVMALQYAVLRTDPVDTDFFSDYAEQPYDAVLSALTKGAIESLAENNKKIVKKEEWAGRGYFALLITLFLPSARFFSI